MPERKREIEREREREREREGKIDNPNSTGIMPGQQEISIHHGFPERKRT